MPGPTSITVRFEPVTREGDTQTVAARVEGVTATPYSLWYRIPSDVEVDDVSRTHAYAISVIHQAMAVGRDMEIEGPATTGLLQNLDAYQRVWSTWLPARFRRVEIRSESIVDDEPYRPAKGALLAFSGGVDSCYTARSLGHEVRALVTIEGLDVALDDAPRFAGVLSRVRAIARTLELPTFVAATNWQAVAPGRPGYVGYLAPTIAIPILMSRPYGRLVIPSDCPFDRLIFPYESNPLTEPMLGRPGFPTHAYGGWARRIDKVEALTSWPAALLHLRPCDKTTSSGAACGACRKCVQTAMLFLGLGQPVPPALGGRAPSIESIESLVMTPYAAMAISDAVDSARTRGVDGPWIYAAERRLAEFGRDASAIPQIHLRDRRLRYLAGGGAKSRVVRFLRRVSRAVRGCTGPPDLAPAPSWPSGTGPRGSRPLLADEISYATTTRGRRLHVEPSDWRGRSLVATGANFGPVAMRIWRDLVASRDWTHVVDVGANYGEMVIDLDARPGLTVIAVEPDPRVRHCLERSLDEALLPFRVVGAAASDREGRVELVVDRTWSGLTSVARGRPDHARHRLESIEVPSTTLRRLLDDGVADAAKRVLVKIDVEGHEAAVLRGLEGSASAFADFAALVEIRHMGERDLAALVDEFFIELYDLTKGVLVAAPVAPPGAWRSILESGTFHRDDAVLRPRAPARHA